MYVLKGNDSPELVVVVQDRETEEVVFLKKSHEFRKGAVLMDGDRFIFHDFADFDTLHDIHVPSFEETNATFSKFHGVDRFRVQPLRKIAGGDSGNHEGQNHEVVVAHFKNDEHGGERCPGSSRKERSHANQGKGPGVIAD